MKDKVVVITGGSSGIGKALAEVFGKNGSKILITGRSQADLDLAVADLKQKGVSVAAIKADVTIEDDNKRMAAEALRIYGKIDVLINNAGITMRALFKDLDLNVVRKVMEINFFGALYATQACLPEIIKNKGTVIGMSSSAGFRGLPERVGYSASKFALNGFLEVLRTEMLYSGVHVLTAAPGFTASNIRKKALTKDGSAQGESHRDEESMMTAEACAQHIYKATVKRKNFLILTAQGKAAVWVNKFFPRLADKLVYKTIAKEADSPLK